MMALQTMKNVKCGTFYLRCTGPIMLLKVLIVTGNHNINPSWQIQSFVLVLPATHIKNFPLVTVHITHEAWHMTTKSLHNTNFHGTYI